MQELPDGQIGRLLVRKSGRMTMLIGNIEFEVYDAGPADIRTEAAFLSPSDGEVLFLGEVTNKLILSPPTADSSVPGKQD